MLNLEFVGPTGQYFWGTIERTSDGAFKDNSTLPTFSPGYTFNQKAFLMNEGSGENRGGYRPSVSFSGISQWANDVYFFRVHDSGAQNKTVAGQLFSLYNGVKVPVGFENTLSNLYHGEIYFTRDTASASQEYTAIFFQNGNIISGSIGGVQLSVVARSNGSTLISSSMTRVGDFAIYKYDTTNPSNFVQLGEAAIAIVTTTASGNYPSLSQATIFGRDG